MQTIWIQMKPHKIWGFIWDPNCLTFRLYIGKKKWVETMNSLKILKETNIWKNYPACKELHRRILAEVFPLYWSVLAISWNWNSGFDLRRTLTNRFPMFANLTWTSLSFHCLYNTKMNLFSRLKHDVQTYLVWAIVLSFSIKFHKFYRKPIVDFTTFLSCTFFICNSYILIS